MAWRTMRVRLWLGVSAALAAAAVIFVLAPWLTSPGPAEETVEQVLASASSVETGVETSDEGVEGEGALPVSVPLLTEDLALGASVAPLQTKAEASGMVAPAGELPELLPPAEVAAVTSELARVASAPDVELDDIQAPSEPPAAEAVRVPEVVIAEPTLAEVVVGAEPVVVEPVTPEALEASEQAFAEPETLEAVEVKESSGSGVPRVEFEMPPGRIAHEGPDGTEIIEWTFGPDIPAVVDTAAAAPSVSSSGVPAAGEVPNPSGEPSMSPVHEAGQAGPLSRLPPQSDSVLVPGTLRGVMGYRLPLVSRQELPDQVVSGVLIPAHTTYVILQPGYWELVGLSPDEIELLRDVATNAKADKPAAQSEPVSRRWNPLNLFRKRKSSEE